MASVKPLVLNAEGTARAIAAGDTLDPAYLPSGVAGSVPHVFKAKIATTQVVADWNWVKAQVATESFDTASVFNNSLYRFQPTQPGYYLLLGALQVTDATASSALGSALYYNGVWTTGGDALTYTSGNVWKYSSVQDIRYFNGTTDYAELWANTSPGATLGSSSYFSGMLISATPAEVGVGFGWHSSASRTTAGAFTGYTLLGGQSYNTGCFNASTGVFTAPQDGLYQFNYTLQKESGTSGRNILQIYLNEALSAEVAETYDPYQDVGGSVAIRLASGNRVELRQGYTADSAINRAQFSGYLVAGRGADGAAGTTGATGAQGPAGPAGSSPVVTLNAYLDTDTSNITMGGTVAVVPLNTVLRDSTGAFNTTTHRFTPQVAGLYQVNYNVLLRGTAITTVNAFVRKNTTEYLGSAQDVDLSGAANMGDGGSLTVAMNGTTDYLDMAVTAYGTSAYIEGSQYHTYLDAFLIGAGTTPVTFNLVGGFTSPVAGTSRKYISAARGFSKATMGLSTPASASITATIKKNGASVGTITVLSGQYYATAVQSISISAGEYLTVDVSGGDATDLVLTLE